MVIDLGKWKGNVTIEVEESQFFVLNFCCFLNLWGSFNKIFNYKMLFYLYLHIKFYNFTK